MAAERWFRSRCSLFFERSSCVGQGVTHTALLVQHASYDIPDTASLIGRPSYDQGLGDFHLSMLEGADERVHYGGVEI